MGKENQVIETLISKLSNRESHIDAGHITSHGNETTYLYDTYSDLETIRDLNLLITMETCAIETSKRRIQIAKVMLRKIKDANYPPKSSCED